MALIPWSLAVSAMWGVTPVAHKYVMSARGVDPRVVMVVSGATYALCIVGYGAFHAKDMVSEYRKLDAGSLGIIAVTAAMTAFLANIIYLYLLRGHTTYVVTAIMYSAPVFTLLLSLLLLRQEQVTPMGCLGTLLIVLGVVCLAVK